MCAFLPNENRRENRAMTRQSGAGLLAAFLTRHGVRTKYLCARWARDDVTWHRMTPAAEGWCAWLWQPLRSKPVHYTLMSFLFGPVKVHNTTLYAFLSSLNNSASYTVQSSEFQSTSPSERWKPFWTDTLIVLESCMLAVLEILLCSTC